jgi:hypothetical protein
MSINTQRLLDAKAIKFGTSVESETYMSAFLEALLKTCTDVQNFTGMPITSPSDVLTDVSIGAEYYSVISYGLDFYLQDTNLFTANPIADADGRFQRSMREAQGLYLQSIDTNVRFGAFPDDDTESENLE